MKKIICACMIIALAGAYAFAGDVAEVTTRQGFTTVYEVRDSLNALATGGTLTNGLAVTGAIAGSTSISAAGAVVSGTEATLTGGQTTLMDGSVVAAANATNAQAVTLSGMVNQLFSTAGADNGTNTITLATVASASVGRMFFIINTGTSNNLAIAKTGNFKSTAIDLNEADAAWLVYTAPNSIYGGAID